MTSPSSARDESGRHTPAVSPILVLVNPQDIVNIASAVRIARNFGIDRMRLVEPELFDPWRIEGIAHNTADFVARIEILPSLQAAIADCVSTFVLTGRERAAKRRTLRPREAAAEVVRDLAAGPVAIIAGREDSGLTNAELDLCRTVVTIATNPSHPSLNLAQAVAIMAYETWSARGGDAAPLKPPRREAAPATSAQLEELFGDWHRALWAIDFFKTRRSDSVMRSLREIRVPRRPRRARGVAGARHGHRGFALSAARRRARRGHAAGRWSHHGRRRGMTQQRSSAYWSANRYADEAVEPAAAAPCKDLPAAAAARFKALRDGLTALPGVAEAVRYMGTSWRWAWEYGVGNRKLCWIHVVGDGLSATFTMSDAEEDRLRKAGRVPAEIARAIEAGQRTGPLRWCWLALDDKRGVETFLRLAGRKAEWLGERPAPHRVPQLRSRRRAGGQDADSE